MTDIEIAIDNCERSIINKAHISAIVAEDAAQSERSVRILFTPEESAKIFEVAQTALEARKKPKGG